MDSESELFEKLKKFCPLFTDEERQKALRHSDADITKAIKYLDLLGVERFKTEFGFSAVTAREMYAAHAGHLASAREHLEIWKSAEKKELKKKERWLKKDPQDKAREIVQLKHLISCHSLSDLGLVEEGGARWDIEPEKWSILGKYDRKLEWLYTAILLIETDHAQNFWNLGERMQREAIQVL
jgi:hypothetical protein